KRRNWEKGGSAPKLVPPGLRASRIAPPGQARMVLGPLPVAALRVDADTVTALARLGLRRIGGLTGMPRAALSRRFGLQVVRRLDQALGLEAEPVSPARPPQHFAVRLTFPDPIGLESDILATLDRLLPELETRLRKAGRGARRVRMECNRSDRGVQSIEVG